MIGHKKKIPGLFYARTENGIELPVPDIMHPLFIQSINEEKLYKMLKKIEKKGDERAESFNKMPLAIKNFLAKRSYIMAGFLLKDTDDTFLKRMSILMMKLGPGLIGSGRKQFFDRFGSKSFGAVTLRMRIRDICELQTELLTQQLRSTKADTICLVNIAGGSAADSINTIIHIARKNPLLLQNKKIEIHVLDIDKFGPAFAHNCLESLKKEGGVFRNLNISLHHLLYNWNNTLPLQNFLSGHNNDLIICSSEGGLFEYASGEEIIQNLNVLYNSVQDDMKIVGSLIRDEKSVDAGILASMKITKIKAKLLGIEGLLKLLEKTNWILDNTISSNPRYLVFTLKKSLSYQ